MMADNPGQRIPERCSCAGVAQLHHLKRKETGYKLLPKSQMKVIRETFAD